MNKKASVGTAVSLIVAVILIGGIVYALLNGETTNTGTFDDTVVDGSNVTASSLSYDDIITGTCSVNATETRDYTIDLTAGTFLVVNDTLVGDDFEVNCSYYPDAYVKSSLARTIILLIPVLAVVGLLFVAVKSGSG